MKQSAKSNKTQRIQQLLANRTPGFLTALQYKHWHDNEAMFEHLLEMRDVLSLDELGELKRLESTKADMEAVISDRYDMYRAMLDGRVAKDALFKTGEIQKPRGLYGLIDDESTASSSYLSIPSNDTVRRVDRNIQGGLPAADLGVAEDELSAVRTALPPEHPLAGSVFAESSNSSLDRVAAMLDGLPAHIGDQMSHDAPPSATSRDAEGSMDMDPGMQELNGQLNDKIDRLAAEIFPNRAGIRSDKSRGQSAALTRIMRTGRKAYSDSLLAKPEVLSMFDGTVQQFTRTRQPLAENGSRTVRPIYSSIRMC